MGGLGERRRLGGLIVGEAADGAKAGRRRLRGRRGTDLRKAAKRTAGGHLPQRKRAHLAARLAAFRNALAARQLQRKSLTANYFLTAKATIQENIHIFANGNSLGPFHATARGYSEWRRKHSSAHAEQVTTKNRQTDKKERQ